RAGVARADFLLLEPALVGGRDPADVTENVRRGFAQRVVAKQPGADLDAGEAEALDGQPGYLIVAEPYLERQAVRAAKVLRKPPESLALERRDLDDLRKLGDDRLEPGIA